MLSGVPDTIPAQRHDDQLAANYLFFHRFRIVWRERKNPLAKSTKGTLLHGFVNEKTTGGIWNTSQLELVLLPNTMIVRNGCEPHVNHSDAVAIHCRTVGKRVVTQEKRPEAKLNG